MPIPIHGNLAVTLAASLFLLLSLSAVHISLHRHASAVGSRRETHRMLSPPSPRRRTLTHSPQVIPLPQKRHVTLPTLPILLLLLGTGFLLHSLFFSTPPPSALAPPGKYTSSPFLVHPTDFIDPPPPDRPSYIPEPVEPKKKGMLVPDAVHYVYGLKPVPEGQRGEELPYYAYLAMRSALINLSPKVIFLYVLLTWAFH